MIDSSHGCPRTVILNVQTEPFYWVASYLLRAWFLGEPAADSLAWNSASTHSPQQSDARSLSHARAVADIRTSALIQHDHADIDGSSDSNKAAQSAPHGMRDAASSTSLALPSPASALVAYLPPPRGVDCHASFGCPHGLFNPRHLGDVTRVSPAVWLAMRRCYPAVTEWPHHSLCFRCVCEQDDAAARNAQAESVKQGKTAGFVVSKQFINLLRIELKKPMPKRNLAALPASINLDILCASHESLNRSARLVSFEFQKSAHFVSAEVWAQQAYLPVPATVGEIVNNVTDTTARVISTSRRCRWLAVATRFSSPSPFFPD
jgi:hypothetical protein